MKSFAFLNSPDLIAESPLEIRRVRHIRMLARVNPVLTVLALALLTGLAVSVSRPAGSFDVPAEKSAAVQPVEAIVLPAPATDGQTAQIKNLFEPATSAGAAGADPSEQYKVVGIILDRNSQAVLKDRQSGKSFFVHKGDRLGGALIGDIQDGKVVLSSDNKSWELRP
jgi:hypothetical protein